MHSDNCFGPKCALILELIETNYEVRLEPQTDHIRIVGRDKHIVNEILTRHGVKVINAVT